MLGPVLLSGRAGFSFPDDRFILAPRKCPILPEEIDEETSHPVAR